MDSRFFIAINTETLHSDPVIEHQISRKNLLPIGRNISYLKTNTEILLRYKDSSGNISHEHTKVQLHKDLYYIKIKNLSDVITEDSQNLILFIEGNSDNASIILINDSEDVFTEYNNSNPSLRLEAYDLPPIDFESVDTSKIVRFFYKHFTEIMPELVPIRIDRFLNDPHILQSLFVHLSNLESKNQISFISYLRTLSEELRPLLDDMIIKINKSHSHLWHEMKNREVSFVDGGMSRIFSVPGIEPTGIRVGSYSVVPGNKEIDSRERWNLESFIISDIFNQVQVFNDENYIIDQGRLKETAQYVLEPLSMINNIQNQTHFALIHGPLQNSFETFNDNRPNYIPSIDPDFLKKYSIDKNTIINAIKYIPTDSRNMIKWNQPIPVYLHIQNKIFSKEIPIAGVIERSNTRIFTHSLLYHLESEGRITTSLRRKVFKILKQYEIKDEFLFGCLLEEGEYIRPIKIKKNIPGRSQEEWADVIEQFPKPMSTIMKTTSSNFPFRIELNNSGRSDDYDILLSLVYHTSRLLPDYAFPVGLDIADKYAKIPDWLSKGISDKLATATLSKALQTGDQRTIMLVKKFLSQNPRDFFFRPKV